MHPIIVLEGADGVGKTTLGTFLAKRMGAKYYHATYRFKDRMFTYHTAVLEQALRTAERQPVILDRWWPSEFLYADEFRGGSAWPMARRLLDRVGLQYGVLYVACIRQNATAHMEQFHQLKAITRPGRGSDPDTVVGIANRYRAWYETVKHRSDFMLYDMDRDGGDLERIYLMIKDRYYMRSGRIPYWWGERKQRQVTGQAIAPRALIVGEKSNPKGRHQVWPFFEHAHSSLWLTETLEQVGITEDQLAWVNAVDTAGWVKPALIANIHKEISPGVIFALGGKAQRVCHLAGVKYTSLPHPAYVTRFQNGDRSQYLTAFGDKLP